MPQRGQPIESNQGYTHKCYKRKKNWGRATQCLDPVTREWVTPEEYERRKFEREPKKEVACPNIEKWQKEWSFQATGYRLSKSELKTYCKKNGKQWVG